MSLAHIIFAVLQATRPDVDPERAETISLAVEATVNEFPKEPMLPAILMTLMEQESSFRDDVHAGDLRGPSGEVCLVQIHQQNAFWKRYVVEYDELVGVDLEATTKCLKTGARTIAWARRKCTKENYKTYWLEASFSAYHLSECWRSKHRFKRAKRTRYWNSLLTEAQGAP